MGELVNFVVTLNIQTCRENSIRKHFALMSLLLYVEISLDFDLYRSIQRMQYELQNKKKLTVTINAIARTIKYIDICFSDFKNLFQTNPV